ncbi:MAG: dockerin type I domain-containing protein, partial [Lachnospiraceae bacterium]|nr:dockerin type I domain-containing protein [Lachnospiraceae bacterium]
TGAYNWETGKWATFDGSSWVAASEELVAYCMDPRNFLDETYIFQFEMLSYNSSIHKKSNVDTLLSGTFMSGTETQSGKSYSTIFMEAGQKSGVSPYHLVARVKQEVGTAGTTGGVTGYYAPSTGNVYRNVYNFYNIGAYTANGRGAVENGLIWASKTDSATLRPWNTKYNAIVGGAIYIGKGYINIGQDTVYYEKFDFAGTPYTHQYMTNILAPKSEAVSMSKAYNSSMKNSVSLVFKIPVFKNMPANTCSCPTGDGSPNNILDKLIIDGYTLTPTFDKFTQNYDLIVANNVDSIKISASAIDSQASISGTGKIALKVGNNTIKVVVTAKNGNNRTYTLNVVRKAADNNNNPTTKPTTKPTQPTTQPTTNPQQTTQPTTKPQETTQPATKPQTANYTTSYKILNNDYLTGISVGTTAAGLSQRFTLSNCKLTVYKSDGKTKNDGIIGTGNRVIITDNSGKKLREFTCVIYGDVNGDGKISILDMTRQKRDILGISKLSGATLIAGDVNKNNGIDIRDMTQIKRDILGIKKISQ